MGKVVKHVSVERRDKILSHKNQLFSSRLSDKAVPFRNDNRLLMYYMVTHIKITPNLSSLMIRHNFYHEKHRN